MPVPRPNRVLAPCPTIKLTGHVPASTLRSMAEAWWAVKQGGLLYLCATDSCTTCGHNWHKSMQGYAAVAHAFPAANEQGLRLVLGTAFREAASRNLHAAPVFAFFHRPSSSFRVMMRLVKPKRPRAAAYEALGYLARCTTCGQQWQVPAQSLGDAAACRPCAHLHDAAIKLHGPMWLGPMHDASFVSLMADEALRREWHDAADLLQCMQSEAAADAGGALLHYHLGEIQRYLQSEAGIEQPPLREMIDLLRAAGFESSTSHLESKALKTSATLEEVRQVVSATVAQTNAGRDDARDIADDQFIDGTEDC